MNGLMAAECASGDKESPRAGPRGKKPKKGTEGQGPHPPVAAVKSPLGSMLASVPCCRSGRLLETISIFIFLGNFTAFISGKIKAVIAGEMIPIRA